VKATPPNKASFHTLYASKFYIWSTAPFYFSCGAAAHIGPRPTLPRYLGRSHAIRHIDNRWDSSGRVISPSQRSIPTQHTANTREEHRYP